VRTYPTNLTEKDANTRLFSGENQILTHLNLYDSPECVRLATQARAGRHLRVLASKNDGGTSQVIEVRLCEDDYRGWLRSEDLNHLKTTGAMYQMADLGESEIQARLSDVIKYAHHAMAQPNHYLWGGTVGPHYDCSGLMQAAFASAGIWIPRDAYQQEEFSQPIQIDDLGPGDLVFFGSAHRATHVGLCIGGSKYIHSSGKDHGRNGIGINRLSSPRDKISQWLYDKLLGAGQVIENYRPQTPQQSFSTSV